MSRSVRSTLRSIDTNVRTIFRPASGGPSGTVGEAYSPGNGSRNDYTYVPLAPSPVRVRGIPRATEDQYSYSHPGDSPGPSRQITDTDPDFDSGAAQMAQVQRIHSKDDDRTSLWLLYASIAAVAYVYSLDQNVTPSFLPIATSHYNHHSILGTIYTAESIINAVTKPFIAKIADVTSRPTAYSVALVFYVAGYLLISCSGWVEQVVAGMLIYTVGHSGVNLVTELLVADLSSLKWRGLVLSLTSLPFLVNTFLGAEIVNIIISADAWRWGYGMFVMILPVVMLSAIFVLKRKRTFSISSLERRRRRRNTQASFTSSHSAVAGDVGADTEDDGPSYYCLIRDFMTKMDFWGLVLIAVSFAFLLLPVTLARSAKKSLDSPLMLTMEGLGVLLLIFFVFYERYGSSYPIMPSRFLVNRAFLAIVSVDFWYFMSGALRSNYLSSYVYVVRDWSTREWTYFNNSTTFALCVFGPIAGLILRYTHRYKSLQISGLVIRVFAMMLTVHSANSSGSSFELISTQLLLGIGGAFNVVGSRVASQASVAHQDLASVIALLSLWTQLGGSVGSAIATRVWTSHMPRNLARHLPNLSSDEIDKLYGSISEVRSYPYNHPIRQGVIRAYEETMTPLWIAALLTSMIPVIAALFLPNYYLGDSHNAVDGAQPGVPDSADAICAPSRTRSPTRMRGSGVLDRTTAQQNYFNERRRSSSISGPSALGLATGDPVDSLRSPLLKGEETSDDDYGDEVDGSFYAVNTAGGRAPVGDAERGNTNAARKSDEETPLISAPSNR